MAGLRAVQERLGEGGPVAEVRGKGLMVGVELVVPGTARPDTQITTRIQEEAKSRRLLIGRGGLYGNVLRIAPPLTVTDEEIDEGVSILEQSVLAAAGQSAQ